MKTTNFLVYGLIDPRDRSIRYVGRSSYGMLRPKSHKTRAFKESNAKAQWLRELFALNLDYEIVALQYVETLEQLDDAEIAWIALGRPSGMLTNISDGGVRVENKGIKRSAATCAKMCAYSRNRTMEHREKLRASAASRKGTKISSVSKQRMRDSALRRGSCLTPEGLKKIVESCTGRKHTEESKRKIAEASRKPERLEAARSRMRVMSSSPEARERLRILARNRGPVSEETRSKMRLAKLGKKRAKHSAETIEKMRIAARRRAHKENL